MSKTLINTPSFKLFLILVVSLLLGFLFNYFFVFKAFGIGFTIFTLVILIGLAMTSHITKRSIRKEAYLLMIPIIFFSAMVAVRASELLTFLNLVATFCLLILLTEIAFGRKLKELFIFDYILLIFQPAKFILPFFQTVSALVSHGKETRKNSKWIQVVRGVAISVPVILLFGALFASADLVVQNFFRNRLSFDVNFESFVRIGIVLFVTAAFIGAYTYTFQAVKDKTEKKLIDLKLQIGFVESSILLASVSLLFFIFILIQLTYLFGGESNLATHGITYAEYARRGFFELIAVALLTLPLLIGVEKFIEKLNSIERKWFNLLSTLLVVQVVLIMGSALIRLALYESAYGLTTLRLYSIVAIPFIAIVLFAALYKLFRGESEGFLTSSALLTLIGFLVFMNLLNPDAFIAKRNLARYEQTGKLDYHYLAQLSDDAFPVSLKVLDYDEDFRSTFAEKIYNDRTRIKQMDIYTDFPSFNFSRVRAEELFQKNKRKIEQSLEGPYIVESNGVLLPGSK